MSVTVTAIYQGGCFRPLEPVAVAEGTPVQLVVLPVLKKTDRTPAQILAEIAALSEEPVGEGFSGRDHDKILYGEKGAR